MSLRKRDSRELTPRGASAAGVGTEGTGRGRSASSTAFGLTAVGVSFSAPISARVSLFGTATGSWPEGAVASSSSPVWRRRAR